MSHCQKFFCIYNVLSCTEEINRDCPWAPESTNDPGTGRANDLDNHQASNRRSENGNSPYAGILQSTRNRSGGLFRGKQVSPGNLPDK